jgi:hypothetical protein
MRTRSFSITAVIAAATLVLGASACGDKKGGDKGKLGAAAQSTLAYFPADSTYAGSIKIAQLQSSGLWKAMWPLVSKVGGAAGVVSEVQAACGLNPLTQVKEVHFGGAGEPMVLLKGLDRAGAKKCAETMAQKRGRKLTITANGQVDEVATARGTHYVHWIDDTTAFASQDQATLAARVAGGGGLDRSDGFLDMASKIDTAADLWVVTRDVKLPSGLPIKIDLDMQAVFMSMNLSNGLHIKGGMRLASDAAAQEAVKRFNGYIDSLKSSMVGSMVGGITFKQSGPDVLVQVKLDTKQVDTVVAMLPMAMAMMKSKLGPLIGDMDFGGGDPDPDDADVPAEAPPAGDVIPPAVVPAPEAPDAPAAPVVPATGGKAEAGSAPAGGGTL